MRFKLFILAFLALFSSKLGCAYDCYTSYECADTTIDDGTSNDVNCFGYYSCYATIKIETEVYNALILCYGSYSCYESNLLQIIATPGARPIFCYGLFSCAYVDYINNGHGSNYYRGELSAAYSTVYMNTDNTFCDGDRACLGAYITNGNNNHFLGHLAAENAILQSTGPTDTYWFQAKDSGYYTTIYCNNGDSCSVTCYADACNHLILVESGSGSFSVDCTYAEYSSVCTNGYQRSSFVYQIPNLRNVTFSTVDNSYNPCKYFLCFTVPQNYTQSER